MQEDDHNTARTLNFDSPEASLGPSYFWRLNELFSDKVSSETIDKLKIYHDELIKFNKKLNLVSPKSLINADIIHFADSMFACESVYKNINKNMPLHDIGSGNGFPGLVFAIMFSDVKVVLVDSDQRKCEFLKHVISRLGLTNATVNNTTVESLAAGSVFQAISRGFAAIPKTFLMLRKTVFQGGSIYFLKSEEWTTEVSQVPTQLCSVWQPSLLSDYILPFLDHRFYVIKADKIGE